MEKMKFLIAVHCHQPVGNFDHVFEMAFNQSYLPFLEVLEKHPEVKVALHYSGSLIDWMEKKKPDFISRIGKLVSQNQIEILSAGYYEPILVLLQPEDRIGQIRLLNEKIYSLWNKKAKGSWLTERVWEPDLPKTFKEAEIEYIIVDDTHFEKAGKNREELWGYYLTDYEDKILKVFPGSKILRYSIPFKLPEETIKYLRQAFESGRKAITFADDVEKFGLWPGTYKWVYEERWLEKFFQMIEENRDWLETVTFSEFIAHSPPTERIYLPCASYDEMLEWSNGYFRNYLAKYPEVNHMHKRMLEVSRKFQNLKFKMQPGELKEAKCYLYMAQSNDSYWHGVFGGLYLNHLRHSVYSNLIKSEKIVDKYYFDEDNQPNFEIIDFDCDGENETILFNQYIKIYLDLKEKAGIYELDDREKEINLINTLARQKEKYHDKIKEKVLKTEKNLSQNQGASSIHDLEKEIPVFWKDFLNYDRYRKGCLLDYFLNSNISKEQFLKGYYEEREQIVHNYLLNYINKEEDSIRVEFLKKILLDESPFEVRKFVEIGKDKKISFQYSITNKSKRDWYGKFGVEFNFSLWDPLLSILGKREFVDYLLIKDTWFNLKIEILWSRKGNLWHFPVETIYETESGFEKNYQELGLLFLWELFSKPEENWIVSGSLEIK